MWPEGSIVGRRITFRGQTLEVVGIVRDIKGRDLFAAPGPIFYVPLAQYYERHVVVHLHTRVPPMLASDALRREVQALDADLPVYGVKALDEHVAATLTPQRLLANLISAVGLLALVLAGIGIYGLLAHTTSADVRDRPACRSIMEASVVRLFVACGCDWLAGLALGLAAAIGVTRLLKSLLFGVSPIDPLTLSAVAAMLMLTAFVACYVPARRAAAAEPKAALRNE
jgi:hypothetical protein